MCRLHPRSAGMPSARLVGARRHACTPNAVVMDEAGAAMFAFCVNKFLHFRPAHPPFIRDLLVGLNLAGRPRPVGHVPRARTWHVEKLNYERKIRAYIELWHDVR